MDISVKVEYKNTKLKDQREKAGLSQGKLADKAGLSVRTLQDYEQGRKNLNGAKLVTLLTLCKSLNCKLSDLISDPLCLTRFKEVCGDEE